MSNIIVAVNGDIGEHIVALGMQLKRREAETRPVAEEFKVARGIFEIQVEARLNMEHRAVIKSYHSGRKILNVEYRLLHHGLALPVAGLDVIPCAYLADTAVMPARQSTSFQKATSATFTTPRRHTCAAAASPLRA